MLNHSVVLKCSEKDCQNQLRITQVFFKREVLPNPNMNAALEKLRDEFKKKEGIDNNEKCAEVLVVETDTEADDSLSSQTTYNTRSSSKTTPQSINDGNLTGWHQKRLSQPIPL
jgi:hypothetical protein